MKISKILLTVPKNTDFDTAIRYAIKKCIDTDARVEFVFNSCIYIIRPESLITAVKSYSVDDPNIPQD